MRFSVGKTQVRMHSLLPAMAAAACLLGGKGVLPMTLALILHEGGHLLAAKCLKLQVRQIDCSPFGGMIRIDRMEALPPLHAFLLVAAGPAASFLGCFLAPALSRIAGSDFARTFAKGSLLICLLNLLPALPLDGGRMLRASLAPIISDAAAEKWLIRSGYFMAAVLVSLSVYLAARGILQLSPAFSGVYLAYCAAMEQRKTLSAFMTALLARRQRIADDVCLPVCCIAASADARLTALLPHIRANKYCVVLALSKDGTEVMGWADEKQLLDAVISNNAATMRDCIKKTAP